MHGVRGYLTQVRIPDCGMTDPFVNSHLCLLPHLPATPKHPFPYFQISLETPVDLLLVLQSLFGYAVCVMGPI